MEWDDLFRHLAFAIPRPTTMQKDYKKTFEKDDEIKHVLNATLEESTFKQFSFFSAVFKDQADTIDYLVDFEKNKKSGLGTWKRIYHDIN